MHQENRKSKRIIRENTSCIFYDKSFKYKVFEFSSDGFSFLSPKNEQSFFNGQNIENIKILNSDNMEIIRAKGIVIHNSTHDTNSDRIGIQYTSKKLDNTIFGKIRVPRITPIVKILVHIKYNSKIFNGHILDYTPGSARVLINCNNQGVSEMENILITMDLFINDKHLQEISGNIVRTSINESESEIVIKFKNGFLNLQSINLQSNIAESVTTFNTINSQLDDISGIEDGFKALVCDWQQYFTKLSTFLSQEEAKNIYPDPQSEALFLEELEKIVFPKIRNFIEKLNTIIDNIGKTSAPKYKKYYRENLVHFFRQAPIGASIIDKIHGYPGDFDTIKQFFNNPYCGSTLFSKLINKFTLSTEPVTAHVERIEYLYKEIVDGFKMTKDEFSILSLGSGPAMEILNFVKDHNFERPVYITLVDLDAHALTDFLENVQYHHKKNVTINLLNQNVKDLLRSKHELIYGKKYDLTYCAGMFDYFNDSICKLFISILLNHTKKGCPFYVTNVHSNNFARHFMDYAGEWELIHRNDEEFLSLIPDGVKCNLHFDTTHTNIYIKGIA